MIHPWKCPNCNGTLKDLSWFCPYCECNLKHDYTKKQNPRCYIASAAYGTPWHADIDMLRQFRDLHLKKNIFGKLFIEMYYQISPILAQIITKSNALKFIIRKQIKMVLLLSET